MKRLLLLISIWGGLNYLSLAQKVTSDSSKVPKIDSLASPLNNLASSTNNYIPAIIPPSPNAASLGKFVETPVGLYNGIPQISIPIYNISLAGNNVPISISYHAGGVKVSDIASNVGLGWSLNAGGVISRTIVGLPDGINGNTGIFPFGNDCITNNADGYQFCYFTAVAKDNDTEPDIFSYNFNGNTGRFIINRQGQIVTIPYSNIKFSPIGAGTTIVSFTATTEDGTIYTFAQNEETLFTPNSIVPNGTIPYFTPTSWNLTAINYPNTSDNITLEYYSESLEYWSPISESYSIIGVLGQSGCPANTPPEEANANCEQNAISHNTVNTESRKNIITNYAASLRKITFPNGYIEFIEDGYRSDVRGYKPLSEIKIFTEDNTLVKKFKLHYNYFSNSIVGSDYQGLPSPPDYQHEQTNNRLFLMDMTEYGKDEQISTPPYEFSYFMPIGTTTTFLPDRTYAKAIDHWGYYNGQLNNTTLIPRREYNIDGITTGANRSPQEFYAKFGTLTSIKYPTGGKAEYEYELNTAVNDLIGYKNVIVPTLEYHLGACHFGGATDVFTINDDISHAAVTNISLTGTTYGFSATSCGTGTLPIPTLSDINTYIYLQILNIDNPSNPIVVYTTPIGNTSIPTNNIPGGKNSLILPNGTYRIRAVRGNSFTPISTLGVGFAQIATYKVDVNYFVSDTTSARPVGGLRIKSIKQFDSNGTSLLTTKVFNYNDDLGKSTGKTNFVPEYKTVRQMCYLGVDTIYYSNSLSQYNPMNSSAVGYSKVTLTEVDGAGNVNGKSESFFSNPIDFVPYLADEDSYLCYNDNWIQGRTNFPFAPNLSQDWRRGLLEKRIDYNWKNNTFNPIKEVTNTYQDDFLGSFRTYRSGDAVGCRVGIRGWTYALGGAGTSCATGKLYFFATQFYLYPSRIVKLIRTQEKNYSN